MSNRQLRRSNRLLENVILRLARLIPARTRVSRFRNLLYRNILGGIGGGARIHPTVELVEPENIHLGEGVTLWPYCHLYGAGVNNKIELAARVTLDRGVVVKCLNFGTGKSTTIEIGEDTLIGPYVCLTGPGDIKIGRDCLISSHTGIHANNHLFADQATPIRMQGITRRGIRIDDDCWLGHGVTVLDGVTIGRGSVVSAGSVVMRDVAPYSIVAGVPAKVIARRTDAVGYSLNGGPDAGQSPDGPHDREASARPA